MKRKLLTLLFAFASILPISAQTKIAYNDDFTVTVDKEVLSVYSVPVDRVANGKHNVVKSSFVTLTETQGNKIVRVHYNKGLIHKVRIRPSSYNIPFIQKDSATIEFTLTRPMNISVEINDDIYHNLHIFKVPEISMSKTKNAVSFDKYKALDKKAKAKVKTLFFTAGYHEIEGNFMDVESGMTVIINKGAWVQGGLRVIGKHDVKIIGAGVLRPKDRGYGVEITSSNNVLVQGIVSTQVPTGGSHDVEIKDVKIVSHYGWGDGFNVFASSNVLIDDCFARNSDDCQTVYATRLGHIGSARNITVQNCIFWADVAHPIFIGLHGAASYKKDVVSRNLPLAQNADEIAIKSDTIENLVYRNIDILEEREMQIDYQGCMAINCGDNNVVQNVLFDNIRIEPINCGMLFNIRVSHNKKYCEAPGKAVNNITFKNITYSSGKESNSIIEGWSVERPVKDVIFDNLVIDGKRICDTMPDKPGWYKTADFARIMLGNHVNNVTFK